MNEEWRDVPGTDGHYQASSWGRIRSVRVLSPSIAAGTGYPCVSTGSRSKRVSVHTLVARAFLGERPEGYHVNHLDSDRTNPRPENLEYCTPKENAQHAVRQKLKTTFNRAQLKAIFDYHYDEGLMLHEIVSRMEPDLGMREVMHGRVKSLLAQWADRKPRKARYELKLTLRDAEKIRELREKGLTVKELAKLYNCDSGHISRVSRGLMRTGAKCGPPKGQFGDGSYKPTGRKRKSDEE